MQADFNETNGALFKELEQLQIEKDSLDQDAPPKCDCENSLEIRSRIFGNGGRHFVWQCLNCGEQRGNPLKKTEALRLLNGCPALDFDKTIEEAWWAKHREYSRRVIDLQERQRLIYEQIYGPSEIYAEIEASKKTREEAELKAKQAIKDLTNLLGTSQALLIFKQQLSEIKQTEIESARNTADRFKSEIELRNWFENYFSADFYIRKEVRGQHLAENVEVRIDFLLKARPHLIHEGYDPALFGVEVKYFPPENDFTYKISRGIWQAISYNDCAFETKNGAQKPKYCLLFSNLSFQNELNLLNDFYGQNDRLEWNAMLGVANHARVGRIVIDGDKNKFMGWSIKFAGGTYFSCRIKDSRHHFRKSNENLINKLRIGNF